MKKICLIPLLIQASISCFSQSDNPLVDYWKAHQAQQAASITTSAVVITSADFTIVAASVEYTYYQGRYSYFKPDLDRMGYYLAVKESQYNGGYSAASNAYGKIYNLKLINPDNQQIVETFRSAAITEADKLNNIDWSIPSNVKTAVNYFSQIFDIESIKNEILLLQHVQEEINRIKVKDPDNFYHSKRYQELQDALKELKSSSNSQISTIAWKYGLV